ncbi:hypothetical protein BKI52_14340 [marine bacterium AO1-C]|nr:hypothetical protein BKI52_14340 [marine bacterium AO1-C]
MTKPQLLKAGLLCVCLLGWVFTTKAQNAHNHSSHKNATSKRFYATANASDVLALKKEWPNDVTIIATKYGVSAIQLTERAGHELHHKVLVHGPGYVFRSSKANALAALESPPAIARQRTRAFTYTIDQDAKVLQSLGMVNNLNIESTILDLVSYGTRYHTTSAASQSAIDLKAKWEAMAAGRSDISIRLVNHTSSNMPSVVLTIQGAELPDEFVIIGGHLDSTNPRNNNDAPGADDDASGIATITEAARVLIDMNFKPKRTLEFMAYAAEEVGLRGSNEIAQDYKNRNVNVVSYVQFDMTNYNGSTNDVYIVNDTYTANTLNTFLTQLMDHYNASGVHKLTYGTTKCNYGCSDHYSWAQKGYDVAFPLEASFQGSNPNIHTSNDTYQNLPTANSVHATKFVKLALEFLIEVGKSSNVGNNCTTPSNLSSSAIGNTVATLSWTGSSSTNSYNVRYREQGTSNWTTTSASTTSVVLNGLQSGTTYEFQVQGVCSGGNSNYTASATFATTGTPTCNGIISFPYTESFESGIGVWTQGTGDDLNWTRDNNGTPSNNTGPSSAADGSYYMYIEASNPNYPSKTADLVSPCVDISSLSQPQLSFSYHMYGASMGTLKVQLSTNGSQWTDLWTQSGNQGNTWNTASIDLPTTSSVITLRFRGTTGNNYTSDITIDQLRIGEKVIAPLNYCASKGNTVTDEWISRVRLGSIDNSSGSSSSGYADFTSQTTNLAKGASNTIIINPAWASQTYSEGYAVWIDYNQNGDFTDNGELVFSQTATSASQVSGSFTIPASAANGNTRMRVSMKYNGLPTSCETFSYGEVEDYTVNIGGSSSRTTDLATFVKDVNLLKQSKGISSRLVPNPTSGFTTIEVGQEKCEVKVFTPQGQEVRQVSYKQKGQQVVLDVSKLRFGFYIITLKSKNGVKVERLWKK